MNTNEMIELGLKCVRLQRAAPWLKDLENLQDIEQRVKVFEPRPGGTGRRRW